MVDRQGLQPFRLALRWHGARPKRDWKGEACWIDSSNLAVLHANDAVGLGGKFVVVRHDHKGGSPRLVQGAHQSEYSFPAMGIEIPGRFIGQDQVRVLHQCARHGYSLLFTTGELAWLVVEAMPQPNLGEKRGRIGFDRSRLSTLDKRRHTSIFECGELSEQVVKLKHEPNPPIAELRLLAVRHAKQVLSIERHSPAAWFIKGANNMEQGTLAGPRGPHDRDQFAALDLKIDPPEYGYLIGAHRKRFVKVDRLNHAQV